jgi:hypothetical protein
MSIQKNQFINDIIKPTNYIQSQTITDNDITDTLTYLNVLLDIHDYTIEETIFKRYI